MRRVVILAVVALVAAAGNSGCYEPAILHCAVLCGTGGACPSGTSCGGDGYCHTQDDLASCLGGDGGEVDGGADAGAAAPCDPMELIDMTGGVFVSGEDGSPGGNGDAVSPLDTIGAALVLARTTGRSHIYVEEGTYPEAIEILDSPNGVTIDGSWTYTGLAWMRDCSADRATKTLIRPDGPIGVTVTDVTHMSGLANLAVGTAARSVSTPADTPGGSRIAVLVRGDGSAFRLSNVILVPGDADHGGPAAIGAAGVGATNCDGMNDCVGGATGMAGPGGADATTPGTFDANGFTPSDGLPGVDVGGVGENGSPGSPTDSRSGCNIGCGCGVCFTAFDGTVTSIGGTCGCGGVGGGPGAAGRGGGASVALLVVGLDATVAIEYSSLQAGDGGDGSVGGAGGPGAPGTTGAPGSPAQYCRHMDCINTCPTCGYNPADTTDLITARLAGGTGGMGGIGGAGGGGAGGPSYAVVTVAGGRVVTDETVSLVPAAGGQGGGEDALDGDSAAILVIQ